jgi:peptidoglycan/xylan/chitin deacetylase (PgdA/CDA1 family)
MNDTQMQIPRILTFHGVGSPKRRLEPGEAPFWLNTDRFSVILDRIVEAPDPQNIVITFDDSNVSDIEVAAPRLTDRGLRATFFVLTGRIGKYGSLSASEIRSLASSGMSIGSHGIAHVDWTAICAQELARELRHSRQALALTCGAPPDAASIPFGRYNASVIRAARDAGYRALYSSDRGGADGATFLWPRTSIRADMTDAVLNDIVSGRLPIVRRARRAGGMWLRRTF